MKYFSEDSERLALGLNTSTRSKFCSRARLKWIDSCDSKYLMTKCPLFIKIWQHNSKASSHNWRLLALSTQELPVRFTQRSETTKSIFLCPLIPNVFSSSLFKTLKAFLQAKSRVIIWTWAMGKIGSLSIAITLAVEVALFTIAWLQLPGDAPRSTILEFFFAMAERNSE